MSPRRFHFRDGKSDKFWVIEVKGSELHVHYGRNGTAGQNKSWSFASPALATKEYDKRLAEKLREGYVEVTGAAPAAGAPPAPSGELSLSVWRKALELAGVPAKKVKSPAKDETPLAWFTGCLWDYAPGAVQTDWKETVVAICETMTTVLETFGIEMTFGEEGDDPLKVVLKGKGAKGAALLHGVSKRNVDQASYVFEVAKLFPPDVEIFSLKGLEDGDSWGYLVLRQKQWQGLRKLLGQEFDEAFAEHPAATDPASKQKAKKVAKKADKTPGKEKAGKKQAAEWPMEKEIQYLREGVKEATIKGSRERLARELKQKLVRSPYCDLRPGVSEREGAQSNPLLLRSITCSGLGEELMAAGALEVLQGKGAGWERLYQGFRYRLWWALSEFEFQDRIAKQEKGVVFRLQPICLTLLAGMALAFPVDRLGARLVQGLRKQEDVIRWWGIPVNQFAARLYALAHGIKLEEKRPWAGAAVFKKALDALPGDEAAFKKAVTKMCDHHVANCDYGVSAERLFGCWPFPFPVEVLAILQVRADLGLPVPAINHSLITKNPLCQVPAGLATTPCEPLLARAAKTCQRDYPRTPQV